MHSKEIYDKYQTILLKVCEDEQIELHVSCYYTFANMKESVMKSPQPNPVDIDLVCRSGQPLEKHPDVEGNESFAVSGVQEEL